MQLNANRDWRIPNRMEALAETAREVFDWLADLPLSSRARYSSGLALEEMVTNIIKYGYDDDREHFINVRLSVNNQHVELVFEDDGHPFDPTQRPAPDVELLVDSHTVGGLGIELVRRMCENMTYVREGAINRVTLQIRRLEPDDTQYLALSELL